MPSCVYLMIYLNFLCICCTFDSVYISNISVGFLGIISQNFDANTYFFDCKTCNSESHSQE